MISTQYSSYLCTPLEYFFAAVRGCTFPFLPFLIGPDFDMRLGRTPEKITGINQRVLGVSVIDRNNNYSTAGDYIS